MDDDVKSQDMRQEINEIGAILMVPHETDVVLTEGVIGWFKIDGKPAAVVGSAGLNRSPDHKKATKGKVLVPLAPRAEVVRGEGLLEVAGQDVATADSEVNVPDVQQPRKSGVLKVRQTFFRVNGKVVARGQ